MSARVRPCPLSGRNGVAAFATPAEAAAYADSQGWPDFDVGPYRPRPPVLPEPPTS